MVEEGRGFLLETVNLISQHSSRNRKSNSVRAALSISCLAAQLDKCTAELINSADILDALMQFSLCVRVLFFQFIHGLIFWLCCGPCGLGGLIYSIDSFLFFLLYILRIDYIL